MRAYDIITVFVSMRLSTIFKARRWAYAFSQQWKTWSS